MCKFLLVFHFNDVSISYSFLDIQRQLITLIILFLVSHFNFLFIPCGRLSWLPVSFLLHVKYPLSYRIVSCQITAWPWNDWNLAPLGRPHTSSYWRFIGTMALSCIIFEIKRDLGRKSRFFSYRTCSRSRRNIAIKFGVKKLEWCGYPMQTKVWGYAYITPACDGRTDGHLATA